MMDLPRVAEPASVAFDDRVRVDLRDDGVALVTLARPDKLNAIDMRMFEAILAAANHVRRDEAVRAIVLSGDGKAFCTGLDLADASALTTAEGRERLMVRSHGDANMFQQCALAWRDMAVPVIAALHGVVLGGGLQIALGADIRYATPDARLSFREVHWGIVPDMGAMVTLGGLIRADVARELIYSARIISGDEALTAGLVTRVTSSPLTDAIDFAAQIAASSAAACSAAKRMLNRMSGGWPSRSEALMMESSEQLALLEAGSLSATISRIKEIEELKAPKIFVRDIR